MLTLLCILAIGLVGMTLVMLVVTASPKPSKTMLDRHKAVDAFWRKAKTYPKFTNLN